MGQVPTVGEVHAENRVARLHAGQIDRLIHGRAGERLYVGVFRPEQLAGALPGGVLQPVREACPA